MLNCPISRLTDSLASEHWTLYTDLLAPSSYLTPFTFHHIMKLTFRQEQDSSQDYRKKVTGLENSYEDFLFYCPTHLSALFVEITVGVVVGVLGVGGVGLHRLHPVQEDHKAARGETLKKSYVEKLSENVPLTLNKITNSSGSVMRAPSPSN